MSENYLSTGAVVYLRLQFFPKIKLKSDWKKKNEITKEKRLFSPFYFLFRRSEIPPRGERPTKPEFAQFLSTVFGNRPRPRWSLDRYSSRYLHVVPEMSLWCLFDSWLSSEPLSEYPQKSLYVRFRLLVFSDLIAFSFFCAAWISKIIYNDHLALSITFDQLSENFPIYEGVASPVS